ncbi:hypothetical protein PV08_02773 [Exophiala spinifera]|uniref:Uncharacterized protein n=1 Tax=Exophiala spinifera TaxID=91928 RepID=A0A0D2BIU6_9EURO|nr:uncharacterized protein PV08_02773 [Exophiala spinifera]KIW18485.1 hypothetical protein PV08_02773 [Exophiala spinifera]
MATGRGRPSPPHGTRVSPNAIMQESNRQLDASYHSWQSRRPQLFHQSQAGSVSRMASNTSVRISVIADDQEHVVKLANTLYDGTLQKSLICEAKALATSGVVRRCQPVILLDHTGRTYTSASTISLRWHYDNGLQTFQETFYIVDRLPRADSRHGARDGSRGGEWDAMLRVGVEPCPDGGPPSAYPYMSVPPDRNAQREDERRKLEEELQKQYEEEKKAQVAKIKEKLLKKAAKR